MPSNEPDLMRELDEAEEIVMGRVESVVTEWGVRRRDNGNDVPCANEYLARLNAAGKNDRSFLAGTVIRRTVTYGPWEEVPGD